MGTRVIKSPAGEPIEIMPDDEWIELTGAESNAGIRQWFIGQKPYAIAELWLGGAVENKSGRASFELHEAMQNRFPSVELSAAGSLSSMMNNPLNVPAFERKTNGKRTHSIKLVALPETWHRKLLEMLDHMGIGRKDSPKVEPPSVNGTLHDSDITTELVEPNDQVDTQLATVEVDEFDRMIRDIELDAPTTYDVKPPLELSIASQVAMSLLTTVVEIISAGSSEAVDQRVQKLTGDLNDIAGKLSARLQENDTLRRQLRQAGDEIIALRTERDGLRSRLRATEANLTAALKGDAVQAINGEIMRRVDEVMRVGPQSKKGDD